MMFGLSRAVFAEHVEAQTVFAVVVQLQQSRSQTHPVALRDLALKQGKLHPNAIVATRFCDLAESLLSVAICVCDIVTDENLHGIPDQVLDVSDQALELSTHKPRAPFACYRKTKGGYSSKSPRNVRAKSAA